MNTTVLADQQKPYMAQLAVAVEYTNCFSAEGWDPPQRVS